MILSVWGFLKKVGFDAAQNCYPPTFLFLNGWNLDFQTWKTLNLLCTWYHIAQLTNSSVNLLLVVVIAGRTHNGRSVFFFCHQLYFPAQYQHFLAQFQRFPARYQHFPAQYQRFTAQCQHFPAQHQHFSAQYQHINLWGGLPSTVLYGQPVVLYTCLPLFPPAHMISYT